MAETKEYTCTIQHWHALAMIVVVTTAVRNLTIGPMKLNSAKCANVIHSNVILFESAFLFTW